MFKPVIFLVIWKVSFNYLSDFMNISEAARHMKLAKIKKDFSGKENDDMENTGVVTN